MNLHSSSFVFLFALLSVVGFGCSASQTVESNVVNDAVQKLSDGKVSADIARDQMVFTDNKTGDLMAFGENVKLPENFPTDIPIYKGSAIVAVTMTEQHDAGASVTLKSEDAPAAIAAWYASTMEAAGFREEQRTTAGGTELRKYSKGGIHIALTIAVRAGGNSPSLITIIRTNK